MHMEKIMGKFIKKGKYDIEMLDKKHLTNGWNPYPQKKY